MCSHLELFRCVQVVSGGFELVPENNTRKMYCKICLHCHSQICTQSSVVSFVSAEYSPRQPAPPPLRPKLKTNPLLRPPVRARMTEGTIEEEQEDQHFFPGTRTPVKTQNLCTAPQSTSVDTKVQVHRSDDTGGLVATGVPDAQGSHADEHNQGTKSNRPASWNVGDNANSPPGQKNTNIPNRPSMGMQAHSASLLVETLPRSGSPLLMGQGHTNRPCLGPPVSSARPSMGTQAIQSRSGTPLGFAQNRGRVISSKSVDSYLVAPPHDPEFVTSQPSERRCQQEEETTSQEPEGQ